MVNKLKKFILSGVLTQTPSLATENLKSIIDEMKWFDITNVNVKHVNQVMECHFEVIFNGTPKKSPVSFSSLFNFDVDPKFNYDAYSEHNDDGAYIEHNEDFLFKVKDKNILYREIFWHLKKECGFYVCTKYFECESDLINAFNEEKHFIAIRALENTFADFHHQFKEQMKHLTDEQLSSYLIEKSELPEFQRMLKFLESKALMKHIKDDSGMADEIRF